MSSDNTRPLLSATNTTTPATTATTITATATVAAATAIAATTVVTAIGNIPRIAPITIPATALNPSAVQELPYCGHESRCVRQVAMWGAQSHHIRGGAGPGAKEGGQGGGLSGIP